MTHFHLLIKGKPKQAEKVLKRIARLNGNDQTKVVISEQLINEIKSNQSGKSYTMLDIFKKGRSMAKVGVIMCCQWFLNGIVYFGVVLNAGALPTDLYLTNVIYSVLGYLQVLYAIIAINTKLGRKGSLISTKSLKAVSKLTFRFL